MVRYIKDGAYTIIIEDNPASPEGKDGENLGSSSKPGSPGDKTKPKGHDLPLEEDGINEVIDFTLPEFMLQNLEIAAPTFEEDKTNLLRGRYDIANHITYQIAFYIYCALQPYSNNPELPSILIMGDGFIGSKVITLLAENGCTPLLRVYSRGEIGAKEWKQRGFQSHSNLTTLMKNEKPNIIVICSEYSSFHMIYHQLSDLHLLTPNACLITSTLGFQRKKLYYNFSIPTILRTYVEPQRQVASYRSNVQQAILALLKNEGADMGMDTRSSLLPTQSPTASKALLETSTTIREDNISVITEARDEDSVDSQTEMSSTASLSKGNLSLDFDDEDDANNEKDSSLNEIQKAAKIVGERNHGIKSMLGLFENYYALHDISFAEARRMALRAIVGYVSIQTPGAGPRSSSRNRSRQQAKRGQVPVKHVEKICISLLTSVVKTFQEEFSKILPIVELNSLVEEVIKVEAEENDSRELYIDPAGKHHYLKRVVPIHRIYTMPEIKDFLDVDDNYSRMEGPAFDFMRAIDERDNHRRGSLTSSVGGMLSPIKSPTGQDQDSLHSGSQESNFSFGLPRG